MLQESLVKTQGWMSRISKQFPIRAHLELSSNDFGAKHCPKSDADVETLAPTFATTGVYAHHQDRGPPPSRRIL